KITLFLVTILLLGSCKKDEDERINERPKSFNSLYELKTDLLLLFGTEMTYSNGYFYVYGSNRREWKIPVLDCSYEVNRTNSNTISVLFRCAYVSDCISYEKESGYLLIPNDRARLSRFTSTFNTGSEVSVQEVKEFFHKAVNYLKVGDI
ncbi:MAG: hypothetical protein Q3983_10195, partial [Capnocytophaga sp.]|nr:hypothetical protein [Capnocytophaga sp.]